MRNIILIALFVVINNIGYAQALVSDVVAQTNQIFIAKDQVVTDTKNLLATLENLGISQELLTNAKETVEKLQTVNTKIKSSKQVLNILSYSDKIITTYYNILTSTQNDSALTPSEVTAHTANLYSLFVATMDITENLTTLLTDNYYEMSDAERLSYIDNLSSSLSNQYYRLQYYALRLASNSASSSIASETLDSFNAFYNF